MLAVEPLPRYRRTDDAIPVVHPPHLGGEAEEVSYLLRTGMRRLSGLLETDPPDASALLVPEEDWKDAPRDGDRPYPYGFPYFTRSTRPPTLVLPRELSRVFGPPTEALLPLTYWHELTHAFLLQREVARTPVWFAELLPQALSAAIAREEGLPLGEHLRRIDPDPGFTIRGFGGRASAEEQMAFQNLLLLFGDAAVRRFGGGFLGRLAHALWDEQHMVDEERADELLAEALGPGGRSWLSSRPEYQGHRRDRDTREMT